MHNNEWILIWVHTFSSHYINVTEYNAYLLINHSIFYMSQISLCFVKKSNYILHFYFTCKKELCIVLWLKPISQTVHTTSKTRNPGFQVPDQNRAAITIFEGAVLKSQRPVQNEKVLAKLAQPQSYSCSFDLPLKKWRKLSGTDGKDITKMK